MTFLRLLSETNLHHIPIQDPFDEEVDSLLKVKYSPLDRIGYGASADVFLGTLEQDNTCVKVVIKRFHMSVRQNCGATSSNRGTHFWLIESAKEICITCHPFLKRHRNIVNMLGVNLDRSTSGQFSLLTYFADLGPLDIVMFQLPDLSLGAKTKIAADIATGLAALHLVGVVHNDVKPSNIMLFRDDETQHNLVAKISDFGAAVILTDESQKRWPGDQYWAAPETYIGRGRLGPFEVTTQRDVYSYGMLLLYLLEHMPHRDNDWITALKTHLFKFSNAGEVSEIGEHFGRVLQGCLEIELSSRWTDLRKAWDELSGFEPGKLLSEQSKEIEVHVALEAMDTERRSEMQEWVRYRLYPPPITSLSYMVAEVFPTLTFISDYRYAIVFT